MESWRKVFRDGFAPQISTEGLEALREALETDDPRLLQGETTQPAPMAHYRDWPTEAACAITFTGWHGKEFTVIEAHEYFAELCFHADQLIGEYAACRYFLNFWDEVPREQACRELLAEVNHILSERDDTAAA